ncbi:MAG: hypothetical protein ABI432_15295 [Flavobacteriales bacterium]
MQRQHFKLAQGYLNIDAEALIFTRSGNWQEAEGARERTKAAKSGGVFRLVTGAVLVVAGGLFFSLAELRFVLKGGSIALAIGLMGLGLFRMYSRLSDDFGPVFRIPFAKVTRLAYAEDHLEVDFLNAAFKEDQVRVRMTVDAGLSAETAWTESRGRM